MPESPKTEASRILYGLYASRNIGCNFGKLQDKSVPAKNLNSQANYIQTNTGVRFWERIREESGVGKVVVHNTVLVPYLFVRMNSID